MSRDPAAAGSRDGTQVAAPEPRQRWRVVFRRRSDAPPMPQRELSAAWEAAILATRLPILTSAGRPRLAFAAALPVGMAADRELVDLVLTDRLAASEVRARLSACLPSGHELVDAHDVWIGSRSVQAEVRGAVYRAELTGDGQQPPVTLDGLVRGVEALLAADQLIRHRDRGGASVAYDLRALLEGIAVRSPGPPPVLEIRMRIDPERGTGQPDAVLEALWEELGWSAADAPRATIMRERLVLADEG